MTPKANDPVQEQLIAARRNQILDAAVQVFAEKGFHRATIRDVAQAAGIADGTIYNYFANKNGLLLGILDRLNQTEQRQEHLEAGTTMDFRAFFRTYLRQRYQTITQHGFEIFQIVLSEVLVNKELREMYFQQVIAPTYDLTEHYLKQQIEAGIIKPMDTKLWLRLISGMTLGLLMLRVMGDPELEARWDDLPDILTDFLLDQIEPSKGE